MFTLINNKKCLNYDIFNYGNCKKFLCFIILVTVFYFTNVKIKELKFGNVKRPFKKVPDTFRISNYLLNSSVTPRICDADKRLIVTVITHPGELERRNLIRNTWGNKTFYDESYSDVVFIMGNTTDKSVILEAETYQDIVITSVVEDYYNLTLKTFAAIQYVSEYCPDVQCIIKTDSDNVLSVKNFEMLCRNQSTMPSETDYIGGRCTVSTAVKRNPLHKWYVPSYVYDKPYFPQYCSTGTYSFIGKNAWRSVYDVALNSSLFNSSNIRHMPEDALFTGIFPSEANIPRISIWGFSYIRHPKVECVDGLTSSYSIHLIGLKNKKKREEYYNFYWEKFRSTLLKPCEILQIPEDKNIFISKYKLLSA